MHAVAISKLYEPVRVRDLLHVSGPFADLIGLQPRLYWLFASSYDFKPIGTLMFYYKLFGSYKEPFFLFQREKKAVTLSCFNFLTYLCKILPYPQI